MGEYKFYIERERGEPLILKPRGDFDLEKVLREEREVFSEFTEHEPFFIIRGAVLAEGSLVDAVDDGIKGHWHFDEGNLLMLSNEFEANARGETQWVHDHALKDAFFAQSTSMRAFADELFSSKSMADRFRELLDDCECGSRDLINRMLGVLYSAPERPLELDKVLRDFERRLNPFVQSCDWAKNGTSTLVVRNCGGFHKAVYGRQGEAKPLVRKCV